jgi:predicted alpha/beta superfamily hydrolase
MRPLTNAFRGFLLCAVAAPGGAQTARQDTAAPPSAIRMGETRILRSALLNEDRRLMITFPENYERTAIRYPVLYVLDGSSNILHVSGVAQFLANARNRIPEMIVVAVPNTNRNRDLTPGPGAAFFARVLAEELIPWVDRTYRTASERVLMGHSLGGSFATHVMLNRPELFRGYVIISAPLWRYDSLSRDMHNGISAAAKAGVGAHLTFGEQENAGIKDGMTRLDSALRAQPAGPRIPWTFVELPGEDHNSTMHRSIYNALEARYASHAFPLFEDTTGLAEVGGVAGMESHYARFSSRMGYRAPPPENRVLSAAGILTRAGRHAEALTFVETYTVDYPSAVQRSMVVIAEDQLRKSQVEAATRTLRRTTELFPSAPNPFDRLADALCRGGDAASAKKARDEALRLARERGMPRVTYFEEKAAKGCG